MPKGINRKADGFGENSGFIEDMNEAPQIAGNPKTLRGLALGIGVYIVLGLASGLYYREMSKVGVIDGPTQLNTLHTHFLALGVLLLGLILMCEGLFATSRVGLFRWVQPLFHAGLGLTTVMMVVRGTTDVLGRHIESAAVPGIAGLGHMILTAALVLWAIALYRSMPTKLNA